MADAKPVQSSDRRKGTLICAAGCLWVSFDPMLTKASGSSPWSILVVKMAAFGLGMSVLAALKAGGVAQLRANGRRFGAVPRGWRWFSAEVAFNVRRALPARLPLLVTSAIAASCASCSC